MPKIANIQLNSQDNIDTNLTIIGQAISTAAAHNVDLVVLPENACAMGSQVALSERYDEIVSYYAKLAQTHNIHIVAGTLPCPLRPDGTGIHGKFRQVSLLFSNTGAQLARYDKIHLFRALVADGVGSYDEGRTFEAGQTPVVARCLLGDVWVGIGMAICFDLRFPRLFQQLRHMGADIITAPSAFTHTTGKAHWQSLLTARALDSQCLIIGAAQGGTHHFIHKDQRQSRQTWGHGMMVDANGQIITTSNITDGGDFIISYANFDKTKQDDIRKAMPIFECMVEHLSLSQIIQ